MSTSNFEPMKYGMPLVCGGLGDFEDYKKSYEDDTGEEYTEDLFYNDLNWEFNDAAELAEKFSKELEYHEVSVKGGYYAGFQFVVTEDNERYFDLDKSSPYCIDNEEANRFYGDCRSKVLRKANAEKNKIKKWLKKTAKEYGYETLVCVGVFSNGEAVYQKA